MRGRLLGVRDARPDARLFAMKRRAALAAVCVFFLSVPLAAGASDCPREGRPAGGGWKRIPSPPLETRDVRLRFGNGARARMTAVRLRHRDFRVRLHWRDKSEWFSPVDLGRLGRKLGAAVLLNAGYYDSSGRPLGYFRSGGKAFNSRVLYQGRRIALHFGALFTVGRGSGAPGIVARGRFREADAAEAFQAGPYLVKDGRPVPGLSRYREYLRPARRTALALDAEERLVVLVSKSETRGVSWCELQEYLALPESEGGLGVRDAMNLDGGSSSQLWVGAGGSEIRIPGRPVPAFVVISPKK